VLPDDCILPGGVGLGPSGKPSRFYREWLFMTVYTDGMPCPPGVEILEGGSLGGQPNREQGKIKPVGIRTSPRRVTFNYREIVQKLVELGLRARLEFV
jgi:hypothetical protein